MTHWDAPPQNVEPTLGNFELLGLLGESPKSNGFLIFQHHFPH